MVPGGMYRTSWRPALSILHHLPLHHTPPLFLSSHFTILNLPVAMAEKADRNLGKWEAGTSWTSPTGPCFLRPPLLCCPSRDFPRPRRFPACFVFKVGLDLDAFPTSVKSSLLVCGPVFNRLADTPDDPSSLPRGAEAKPDFSGHVPAGPPLPLASEGRNDVQLSGLRPSI